MCPLECAGTRGLVGQLLPVGTVLNLVRVGAGSAAVPCPNALYDGTEQCNHQKCFLSHICFNHLVLYLAG